MDKFLWILLSVTLILFSLYLPINSSSGFVLSFKTPIDDLIPLWSPFLLIYISYFGFVVFTYFYLVKKRIQILKVTLLALIIACIAAYLFYLFFQNGVERPVIKSRNVYDIFYTWINSWVAPYNAFPSLHVAISTICAISYFQIKSVLKWLMLVWVILIIASTVLTKQHYFLDVVSGLVLGVLSFKAASYSLRIKLM